MRLVSWGAFHGGAFHGGAFHGGALHGERFMGSVSWGSVSWGSVSWGSVSWGAFHGGSFAWVVGWRHQPQADRHPGRHHGVGVKIRWGSATATAARCGLRPSAPCDLG